MGKIYKCSELELYELMANDFINSFDNLIIEDHKKSKYKGLFDKITSDLKLNVSYVGLFGAGITVFYPIVEKLMMRISDIEITDETVILSTICAASIIYLEEKKSKNVKEEDEITMDSKSMLEELKMKGVGNGIIKKLIKAFQAIKNIFSIIGKHIGALIGGFVDMFAYVAIMIPILNAIQFIIGKYDLNLDTIVQNFIGLSIGVGTLIAKHGIIDIINRLKSKFPLDKKRIMDEIETPVIQKFGDRTYGVNPTEDDGAEMIKEQ